MEALQVQLNKALRELEELVKITNGSIFKRVYNQGFDRVNNNYDRQLANLRPGIFQDGCLACLKKLGVPLNILL